MMKRTARRTLLATAIAAALTAPAAHATVGYFQHGYGDRAKAMGGAGIAYPQDSIAAATNPAGMVLVGDRMDFGAGVFVPVRDATISGHDPTSIGYPAAMDADGSYDLNNDASFPLAHFGYNRMVRPNMSFGVTIYGNGGMNTSYESAIPFFSGGNPNVAQGVDLMQLFVAPTLAFKVNDAHAIGVSLVLAAQRFKANGLQSFANSGFSRYPTEVTNKGYDMSTGAGVRVGWIGQVAPNVSVGLTYATKTYMSKFDKYRGLFAEGGDFDIPANYGIGVAFKASDRTTVAVDVMRIEYEGVRSVGNPGPSNADFTMSGLKPERRLGETNGLGFGWRDVTAFKLGVAHQYSGQLTLRGGLVYNTQPIPASEVMFNSLAPGVIQKHLTLGATWKLANGGELTISYFHAFNEEVTGNWPTALGGGTETIKMYQNALGISYGMPLGGK